MTSARLCIKGARVIDPHEDRIFTADVRIAGDTISQVGENLRPDPEETEFDATDCWLMPGFTDMHTHLRDLAQTDRETVRSGTKAAAAGGYT
ncbi:MAG: dihydroorotase, partial [Terriglobales bacterium]